MTDIADAMTAAGHPVYLPHRDGMEFRRIHPPAVRRGYDKDEAAEFLHKSIFAPGRVPVGGGLRRDGPGT